MSNSMPRDVKTRGLVLRRTNYGEADRVLSIITLEGKLSVMARGVRKARSKLAGAVEMFTLSELNIHFGRSEMGVLTGARMVRHFGELVKDLAKLELASEMLRRVDRAAEGANTAEYYNIVEQSLTGLNDGIDAELVEAWYELHLKKAIGEEINLYRDTLGCRLTADEKYEWNGMEEAFEVTSGGKFGSDEIKLLRLMQVAELATVQRIKCDKNTMREAVTLARIV
ncbi:DNA repair protein RecO [Candidatus Saccharibacteria bacterium]|nr:DNA repair protein RecO [Candidatus Saccharibacteria bacterium]